MTLAWIVELEPGVWLSDTSSGDPPRTLIRENVSAVRSCAGGKAKRKEKP